jgi:hypothetical protein
MDALIQAIRDSLAAITTPRFYETERGYQGELYAELRKRLPIIEMEGAIIEQEYQKRMKDHGFRIRPDLIIHVPFEGSGLGSRAEGNFVVIELKHRASLKNAHVDFANLSAMCEALDYPLGVFINIASTDTHFANYEGPHRERLLAFAVQLSGDGVVIHEQK